MYNYQTFVKESKLRRRLDQIRRQYYEDINHKQKINGTLIQSHKKRIEGFILSMVQKPQSINVYQDVNYKPRQSQKPLQIHEKSFNLNHHTDQQRINQISSKNLIYDSVPFNNTYSHRFRDFKDQSKLKPMKYTSINSSIRVKQKLDSSILNYLPNVNNKRMDKLIKNPQISWNDKKVIKQLNKSLLPQMHNKTYFQSLKTIYTECPNGFMNTKQKDNVIQKIDQYNDQIQQDTRKNVKNSGEITNRKENSKEALIKCGLLGGRKNVYRIGMEKSSKKVYPIMNQTSTLRF